jgi:catechol 2,3-dioxygenase-like lactoylglutathione lyase family enzyme
LVTAVPDRGRRLVGPILSTRDPGPHRELLVEVFGLAPDASIEFDASQSRALWGVDANAAFAELYLTPGTLSGVLLVRLDPPSPRSIRDRRRGDEHDALKVIDFYARDFDASLVALAARGYAVRDSIADYEMAEGRFREAHLWTEDEVVYALLDGPADFMDRVVQISDRPFSEVMSVSTPTRERDAAMRFYKEVLGFEDVYRYGFDADSFGELVDGSGGMQLTGVNMGTTLDQPFFGLIHYGTRSDTAVSLAGRAGFPDRGIAAALVEVPDLEACIDACREWPGSLLCPPVEIVLGSFGRVSSALLRAPHGIAHQLIQRT